MAHESVRGAMDSHFPRLGQMIVDYEHPIKKMAEEFIPLSKVHVPDHLLAIGMIIILTLKSRCCSSVVHSWFYSFCTYCTCILGDCSSSHVTGESVYQSQPHSRSTTKTECVDS